MLPGFSTFNEGQILAFALILLRSLSFMIAWPVFGANNVPIQAKLLFSVVLAALLMPIIRYQDPQNLVMTNLLLIFSAKEVMIGLMLGFLTRLFFFAISAAGELMSVSMGISSAQLFNPLLGANSNVIDQLHMTLATMFFLLINGHHLFISALVKSFDLIPLTNLWFRVDGFLNVAGFLQDVMIIGIKIAAPMIISIFIANISMGILGRAVPQINVLATSLPVTMLIGFGVILICIPVYVTELSTMLDVLSVKLMLAMKGM